MTVTSIVPEGRTKYAVAIDGECVFTLYKGELSRYRIRKAENFLKKRLRKSCRRFFPNGRSFAA